MKKLFFALCAVIFTLGSAVAQNAPAAIYILYSNANMDVLDYRTAFSNNSATYYAYALRNGNDRFLMYTGSGIFADKLPNGTVRSVDFRFTEDIRESVNRLNRQMFIVWQQQQGYTVVPVTAVTKVTKSGNYYLVNSANYSFVLDTVNLTMGRELATAGSQSSISLTSWGFKNCRQSYAFRRTPQQANLETAEFELIPGIGMVSDKSGRNASEMQANQVFLWGVNGLALDDYINRGCPNIVNPSASLPPPPAPGVTAPRDPRLGDPATGDPTPYAPGTVVYSALSGQPAVNCPRQSTAGFHVVQPKETLNLIARFYGVTTKQIMTWNNIKNADKITICQELRVAAPGALIEQPIGPRQAPGTTLIQQQKSPNAPGTRQVMTPPLTSTQTKEYQSVQPGSNADLPDLFGPSATTYATPSPGLQPQYPAIQPQYPAVQPQYSTTPAPNNNTQYYSVQKGDGIQAIARKFGYTEERIRYINGFPATGNVPLQVGQMIKVNDCDVPMGTGSVQPQWNNPQPNYTPGASPIATGVPSGSGFKSPLTPINGSSIPATQPIANSPLTKTPTNTVPAANPALTPIASADNAGKKAGFVPLGGGGNLNSTVTTGTPVTQPVVDNTAKRDPISFQEYFVKDSESVRDIARKKKLDAAELGLINGRDPNEVLAPGTKVMIPVY